MFIIINISDSDKHFKTAQDEYLKRLGKSIIVDTIKPEKFGNKTQIIEKETKKIIYKIQKKYTDNDIFILSINGENINTNQFIDLVKKNTKKKVFLIGGPYGINEELLIKFFPYAKKISFGKITMPHGLAKLVLFEQLYRIICINNGKKYHY